MGLSDWSHSLMSFPELLGFDDDIDPDRDRKTVMRVIMLWYTVVDVFGYTMIVICFLNLTM